MRRLLLLRHAKAVQDAGGGDIARVLAPRGRSDAPRIARAMDTKAYWPELVLCSAAARTRETLELVLPELSKTPRVEYFKSLYLAPPKQILDLVRKTADEVRMLMVVGHNPGMEELATDLPGKPQSKSEAKQLEAMDEKFPTCALAVVEFDGAWSAIAAGKGTLTDFLRPKDIRD